MPDDVVGIDLVEGTDISIVKSIIAGTRGDLASYEISSTGGGVGGSFIGARVYHSTTQSLATGTVTTLTFDTESNPAYFDTDAMHDAGTPNRLTCNTAGYYLIQGAVRFPANATGTRYLLLRLNGTTYIAVDQRSNAGLNSGSPALTDVQIHTLYKLAVGDYVELQAVQYSGSTLSVGDSPFSPVFSMARLG